MHLPSFLWLWKIAAWSMGLSLAVYAVLAASGLWVLTRRPGGRGGRAVRRLHLGAGVVLVSLTLLLLGIGVVGTLGRFGSLGHSPHLGSGLFVVALVSTCAWTARQMFRGRRWAKPLHLGAGSLLLVGFAAVLATGWQVVQKYLPP
ncbi:DUF4079 domain-containing protein [Gloeobacter morelensis]|uniref:DUF4079 domain-containing protein n=1 Tax=Gloeobacter morelensis MG652769 TaxID=2781736 RepID=A0ABY3PFZ0_9CYAN|nr:DUF4079 domain-containing protein [Gloeobacter morelensis]UFP92567.1 DUF4079 domain-containing protein [Gloeobacter morelensis MG652769]